MAKQPLLKIAIGLLTLPFFLNSKKKGSVNQSASLPPPLPLSSERINLTKKTAITTTAAKTKNETSKSMMTRIFSIPLESWYTILQWTAAILVGVTFLVGIATVWIGDKVNRRQTERIALLEKARADAELALERLRARQEPRSSAVPTLIKVLEGKPTGEVEILFQDGDAESLEFTLWLEKVLIYSKWKVSEPRPIGDTVSGSYSGIRKEDIQTMPPAMRLGASLIGVTIVANRKTLDTMKDKETNPLKALLYALMASDIRAKLGQDDSSLPDGFLRIVVAPKG
jgi:hypothetical protein